MKTTKSLAKSAACSLTAVLLVPGVTHAQVGSTISYKLNPGSTYQTGCFPPCACPLSQEFELSGTFTLRCTSSKGGGVFITFAIASIDWTVSVEPRPDPPVGITGSGIYTTFSEVVGEHRMRLDLAVGDAPRRWFVTDWVIGGNGLLSIEITLANNDMSCQDTVIVLNASPVGACCPNGPDDPACLVETEAQCVTQGGTYQGIATTCPTEPGTPCGSAEEVGFSCSLPPEGSCCFPSPASSQPACLISTEEECAAAGGIYVGGADCDPVLCDATPLGCCHSDGTCTTLNLERCARQGSIALGLGSSCGTTDCANVMGGACCAADLSLEYPCFEATLEACAFAGGTYHGDGTTCPPVAEDLCGPYTGACCLANASATEATCEVATFDACLAGDGIYQGDHTDCGASECNCCFPLRSCTSMPAGVCSDTLSRLPAIPTVSAWGALVMALLLGAVGSAVIVRRGFDRRVRR